MNKKTLICGILTLTIIGIISISGCVQEQDGHQGDWQQGDGVVGQDISEGLGLSFVEGDSGSWHVDILDTGLSPSWFRFDYLSEGSSLRCRQFESLEDAQNNINPLGEAIIDYVEIPLEGYFFGFGDGATKVYIILGISNFPPKGYAIYKYEAVDEEPEVEGEGNWTFEGIRISGEVGNEIGLDPEVFQLPDGSYCMYLADSESHEIGPVVASSPDGLTWTVEPEREDVLGDGPSIFELPSGGYRAYWQRKSGNWEIMTAISSDGYNWEDETICTSSNMEDFYGALPSVVLSPDGTYQMYYTRETGSPTQRIWSIYSAHSSDGLVWESDPGIRIDGAEEIDRGHASSGDAYTREDGKYEMVYVSGGTEIYWAVSDDGLNWTRMGYTGIQGLDPIINVFPDGIVRMYYGTTAADWFPPSDKPPGIYSAIRGPIE